MFRLDCSKTPHKAMEDMCTTAAIIDCSVRLLTIFEDRRSPHHNRYYSCDYSRSLRIVVGPSKIAAIIARDWSYTGRKLVVNDRKPHVTAL